MFVPRGAVQARIHEKAKIQGLWMASEVGLASTLYLVQPLLLQPFEGVSQMDGRPISVWNSVFQTNTSLTNRTDFMWNPWLSWTGLNAFL